MLQKKLNSNRISSNPRLPIIPRSNNSKLSKLVRVKMPGTVDTLSRVKEKYVIDTVFLPDWMYFYPNFIRDEQLSVIVTEELKNIKVFESLKPAVEQMEASNDISDVDYRDIPFRPAVVDSGVKMAINARTNYISRQWRFKRCYLAQEFWDRLTEPRLHKLAKKRLIEFSSQDRTSALICLLTSPRDEKPQFLEFLRRHDLSTNFFGECVDWRLNVWDTELHLAFYQLVDGESEHPVSKPSNFHGGLRTRNMPSLLGTSHLRKITPMVMSFRFVGDLRDRFWTCSFISSASPKTGFVGFAYEAEWKKDRGKLFIEKQAQRRLLQLSYVERMLEEMSKSNQIILAAFQKELDVPESRDPQSESFEFIFSYSSLYMRSGEILRDIWQRLDFSIQTVGEWERREETRRLRSRWSEKDEERYGKKLRDLTQKCKSNLQLLRAQHKRLEEQKTFAEQRHNNLISYMQLREARTSTRSSEDVRLFTYVTIIFLPLTFSSSLFSMQGAPHANTVSIMVQTTVVALVVTILFLSNLKLLDRNWSFHVHRFNALARSKMKASKHPWALDWHKKQTDLEEVAQRQISKMDYAKPLPAESKWWYFLFWLTYILRMPRTFVTDGFIAWQNHQKEPLLIIRQTLLALFFTPACTFIFVMQLLLTTLVDFIYLLWVLACLLGRWLWNSSPSEPERKEQLENTADQDDYNSLSTTTPSMYTEKHTRSHSTIDTLSSWLKYPPRPIHKKTRDFEAGQSKAEPPKSADPNESKPISRSNTQNESEKLWAAVIKKRVTGENEIRPSGLEMSQLSPEGPTTGNAPTSIHRTFTRLFERPKKANSKV